MVKKRAQVLSWFTHNLQVKSDHFLQLILLDYCSLIIQYMIQYMECLFEKTFVIFDRLSIK